MIPRFQRLAPLRSIAAALAVCCAGASHAALAPGKNVAVLSALAAPDGAAESATESQSLALKGLRLLSQSQLEDASRAINSALLLDTRNSALHFFNGFTYHLMARRGDADKLDIAIEGYRQAIHFDRNNWVAHEFLGLANMEQKQYASAQSEFAEVLLARPEDVDALARAMAASYMAGDAGAACALADRILALSARPGADIVHATVPVYAACGKFAAARVQREAFAQSANPRELAQLDRRLKDWSAFHASLEAQPRLLKVAEAPVPPDAPSAPAAQETDGKPSSLPRTLPSSGDTRMVLVDVVMVRTEDTIATSKGVNLLNALSLQFGSPSSPAFGKVVSSGTAGTTTILSRAVTIPALTYSLNIANASSQLNEVLARPTLAALEGVRSEFFSGTTLNAAVVSSGGAAGGGSAVSIEKRYGVRLAILPQILANGMIRLSIDAARTFLKPPSSDIGFTYKLEISEITANANVVMRMGDTLVLGGLSEKESTRSRDGVPGLQDVPGVQYLFANQTKTAYQKSVLILITPRPASYTWLSDASRRAFASSPDDPFTPSMDVLRARNGDWFKPYPNLASTFHHLNSADLYREFRTGDVALEAWERMDSTRERLRQALDFLFY